MTEREYTDADGATYSCSIDVDPADVPDHPALREVGMRDSRDDVLPWQAQQLERLGCEGPPPRDRFEAQAFIDAVRPAKATPEPADPNDLSTAQLDAIYGGVM